MRIVLGECQTVQMGELCLQAKTKEVAEGSWDKSVKLALRLVWSFGEIGILTLAVCLKKCYWYSGAEMEEQSLDLEPWYELILALKNGLVERQLFQGRPSASCDSPLLGSAGQDKSGGSLEGRRDAPVRKKGVIYVRSDEGSRRRQKTGRGGVAVESSNTMRGRYYHLIVIMRLDQSLPCWI